MLGLAITFDRGRIPDAGLAITLHVGVSGGCYNPAPSSFNNNAPRMPAHHEGGDEPIGRFEKTMSGVGEVAREKFYSVNFRGFMGDRLNS